MIKHIYLLLSGVFSVLFISGQTINISVVDSITGQNIPGVRLHLPSGKIIITNHSGSIRLPCEEGILYTDAIGYHSDSLLIHCGDSLLNIALCSDEIHLDAYQVKGYIEKDQGIHASKITRQDLDANRFKTAGDLLLHLTGVTLIRTGSSISKPVIRGHTGIRLISVYDGFRQEGQQWGMDHGMETDPSSVGTLKVIKGAGSLLYGTEGNGVIIMSPLPYRPIKGIESNTYVSYASNNREMGLAQNVFYTKNKLYVKLLGSFRYGGDNHAPDYNLSNTGIRNYNIQGSAKFGTASNYHEWSWSSLYQKLGILRASHIDNIATISSSKGLSKPVYIKPFTYQVANPHQKVIQNQFSYRKKNILTSGWIRTISQSFQHQLRYEFDLYNPAYGNAANPNFSANLTTSYTDLKFEKNLQNEVNLITGVQNIFQYNFCGGRRYIIPDFINNRCGLYSFISKTYSKWQLSAGGRADISLLNVSRIRYQTFESKENNFSGLTSYISLLYKITGNHLLTFHTGTGWRAPNVSELYSCGFHGATGNFERGNPGMKKEQSLSQELNFRLNKKNITFELAIFFQHFYNYIYIKPTGKSITTISGNFPEMFYQQDPANLWGFESQLIQQFRHGKTLMLGVNYLRSKNLRTGYAIWLMPPPRGYLTFKKQWKDGWNWQFELQVVTAQIYIQPNTDLLPPPNAYSLFTGSLNGAVKINKQKWDFNLIISNIFNQSYRDYLSRYRYFSDETGRDIRLIIHIPYHNTPKHIHQ